MGSPAAQMHRHAGYAPNSSLHAGCRDQLELWIFCFLVGSSLRHLPCGARTGSRADGDWSEQLSEPIEPGRTLDIAISKRGWPIPLYQRASGPHLKANCLMRSHRLVGLQLLTCDSISKSG